MHAGLINDIPGEDLAYLSMIDLMQRANRTIAQDIDQQPARDAVILAGGTPPERSRG